MSVVGEENDKVRNVVKHGLIPLTNTLLCLLTVRKARRNPNIRGYLPSDSLKSYAGLWALSGATLFCGFKDAGLAINLSTSIAYTFQSFGFFKHGLFLNNLTLASALTQGALSAVALYHRREDEEEEN